MEQQWFNVWFDPVTVCSVCNEDATKYIIRNRKKKSFEEYAEFNHNESCIWYTRCVEKVLSVNPEVKVFSTQDIRTRKAKELVLWHSYGSGVHYGTGHDRNLCYCKEIKNLPTHKEMINGKI